MSMLVTRQLFRPKGGTWSTDHSHTIKQTVRHGSDAGSYSLFQCYIRVVIEFFAHTDRPQIPERFPLNNSVVTRRPLYLGTLAGLYL